MIVKAVHGTGQDVQGPADSPIFIRQLTPEGAKAFPQVP